MLFIFNGFIMQQRCQLVKAILWANQSSTSSIF